MFHPVEPPSEDAKLIVPFLGNPKSVLDLGCNVGYWLAALEKVSSAYTFGVDGPGMAEHIVYRGCFLEHDLTKPLDLEIKFDLVICVEVAEHIVADYADVLVDTVVRHAEKMILFSAATPGQGGYKHVNEQPFEYWESKFLESGWAAVLKIQHDIKDLPVAWWLKKNLCTLVPI
jgi:SAM-dependent methyltransferase